MGSSLIEILNRVKAGDISVAEGEASLSRLEKQREALDSENSFPNTAVAQAHVETDEIEPEIGWWKYAWLIILLSGTTIFVFGAWMISWAYPNGRMFWFYCAWLPLMFGLVALLLGAWSKFARWVHVRVQEASGSRVSISLPVPIALLSLGMRLFGSRIKRMEGQNPADIAAVLQALGKTHDPISVEVDEKNGDRVRVYIL